MTAAAAAAAAAGAASRAAGASEVRRGPVWTVAQLRRCCGGLTAPELARRAGVPLRTVYLMEIGGAVSREEAWRVLRVLRERLARCGLGEIEVVGGFIVSEELQRQAWRVLTESDFRLLVYGSQVPLPPLAEAGAGTDAGRDTGTGVGRGAAREIGREAGRGVGRGASTDVGSEAAPAAATGAGPGVGPGASAGAGTGASTGEAGASRVPGQASPDTGRDMSRGMGEAEAEGVSSGGSALGVEAVGEEGQRGVGQADQVQTRPPGAGAMASASAGAARLGRWARSQRLSRIPFS